MISLIEEVEEEEEAGSILRIPPMQQCQLPELSIQICHTSDHYSSFSSASDKKQTK